LTHQDQTKCREDSRSKTEAWARISRNIKKL
jgi:hypothetical protein